MNNFLSMLRRSFLSLERYQRYVLIAWLLVLISLPLLSAFFSQPTALQGLSLLILLQVAFVLNVLYRSWGWWGMLRTAVEVLFFVWVVLAIVIRSGLPYGNLHYSGALQPSIFGVPLAIPLSWLMMLPPAWAVSRLVTRRLSGCLLRLVFVAVSATAFTAWVVYFEPLLVHLGISIWNPFGSFSGTPWPHFAAVFFLAGLITFAVSPKRMQGGPLVLIYILIWLVDLITSLFIQGLVWPGVVSMLLMGLILLGALLVSE